jgi:hypothetical protein
VYDSASIIHIIKLRRIRLAGYVAHMEDMINTCNMFVGKSEGKGLLERPRCRWQDNIRMDLR